MADMQDCMETGDLSSSSSDLGPNISDGPLVDLVFRGDRSPHIWTHGLVDSDNEYGYHSTYLVGRDGFMVMPGSLRLYLIAGTYIRNSCKNDWFYGKVPVSDYSKFVSYVNSLDQSMVFIFDFKDVGTGDERAEVFVVVLSEENFRLEGFAHFRWLDEITSTFHLSSPIPSPTIPSPTVDTASTTGPSRESLLEILDNGGSLPISWEKGLCRCSKVSNRTDTFVRLSPEIRLFAFLTEQFRRRYPGQWYYGVVPKTELGRFVELVDDMRRFRLIVLKLGGEIHAILETDGEMAIPYLRPVLTEETLVRLLTAVLPPTAPSV
ncbi:synaptonemal complex protein [Lasius niger]|uniref:Synaptonemal complex protein n=1 Tax=Lasius niger TaxID=67767 RepID=A0A0J7JXE5_LASNI|nr:synaptonemal complex protein [Lasius niger]